MMDRCWSADVKQRYPSIPQPQDETFDNAAAQLSCLENRAFCRDFISHRGAVPEAKREESQFMLFHAEYFY
jgi:hypothetical protein